MARRPRQVVRDRRLRSRWNIDKRRQRALVTAGVIILLVILAIPAYGYYTSYIQPARVTAAQVGNATITMGDVVKTIRAHYAMGAYQEDATALGSAPFETVYNMTENELVYQAALRQGVTASDEEVALYVRYLFYPWPEEGEEVDPADLEREYKENYRRFLTGAGLSDGEFRRMVRYSVISSKMEERIAQRVPNQETHVEAYWMMVTEGEQFQKAQEELAAGKDFAEVCKAYNVEAQFADENCYVGWIPKGAFPALEETLFSIEHGKVSDPILSESSWYLLKVVGGPEVRDVSEPMREQLEIQAYKSWTQSLWKEYTDSGLLRVNFDSVKYDWVMKEVRSFLPTPTPTQAAGT